VEAAKIWKKKKEKKREKKHTTAGIRWWSPTQLLICRSEAYVWQSGRDAQFSSVCGRMWKQYIVLKSITLVGWANISLPLGARGGSKIRTHVQAAGENGDKYRLSRR
jgi:hypothetical protein